jgi:hypothetical protein
MEKVAGEDKIVEEREKSPPGGPAPRKRQRADTDGASGASFCDDVVTNILARLPARSAVTCTALSKHQPPDPQPGVQEPPPPPRPTARCHARTSRTSRRRP